MTKTGLFFGSFNPIHTGHLILAYWIKESVSLDQVWFIISPLNPLKEKHSLLNEQARMNLVNTAIQGEDTFKALDIEFDMPPPVYTIDTLKRLKKIYPTTKFFLMMGEDNLAVFNQWNAYEQILKEYTLLVYPRLYTKADLSLKGDHIIRMDAPVVDISATLIRKRISERKSIKYLVPDPVLTLIQEKQYFKHVYSVQ